MVCATPNRLATAIVLVGMGLAIACHSTPDIRRYSMTGSVVAVHPETATLTIHNDDVPGFMSPMDMDYKVRNKQSIAAVKSGDRIKGTIVVEDHNPAQLDDVVVLPR